MHRTTRAAKVAAALACGVILFASPALCGPFDSIPTGPGEQIILTQSSTLPANGAMSNLFVPGHFTVSFDYAVEPGKQVLIVVIDEAQMQELNSGADLTGSPLMRANVAGVGTRSVVLERGTYGVYIVPSSGPTYLDLRARGG